MSAPVLYDDLKNNEIRLLELFPGNVEAEIECRLSKVALSAKPDYEAISYVWGDSTGTETILCNNKAVEVTVSLAQALRRLRSAHSEDAPRVLWADAICINQSNLLEKNTQVPLMTKIYSAAGRVVVWTGLKDTKVATTAVKVIERINFLCVQQPIDDPHFDEVNEPVCDVKLSALEAFIQEQDLKDVWQSLRSLFSVQYWSRIWCAQEVGLARETLFLIGPEETTGIQIGLFTAWYLHRILRDFDEQDLHGEPLGMTIVERAYVMLNYKDGHFFDDRHLCVTLDGFRDSHATDARDKVYGLLGIHEQACGKPSTVVVDYRKSVTEVYTDTALNIISTCNDLHILSYVDHGEEYAPFSGHPSWVPKWDCARTLGQTRILSLTTSLSAGRYDTRFARFPLLPSDGLLLRGILFDYTLAPSACLGVDKYLELDPNFVVPLARLWVEVSTSKSEYAHHISTVELAATLISGFRALSDQGILLEDFDSDIGRRMIGGFHRFLWMLKLPLSNCRDTLQLGRDFLNLARCGCSMRRIFRTRRGYLGLGPACMREGDIVVVLDGGKVPYILRPLTDSTYAFMGECFVYAIRNGEAYDMVGIDGVERQELELC